MFCLKQIKEDKILFVLFLFFHALLYFVLLINGGAIEILENFDETTKLIFKSLILFSLGYWFSSLFELIFLIIDSVAILLANLTKRFKK